MKERSEYLSQQKNFTLLLFIYLGSYAYSSADGFPFPMGARSWGIGNATVARPDFTSGFTNMAGLGGLSEVVAFSAYDSHYGFEGIGTFSFRAVGPVSSDLGIGMTFQRFGDKLYNESAIGIGAGHRIGRFRLGLKANYLQNAVNAPSLTFSRSAIAFELGGIVEVTSKFFFGAQVFNLTQASYSGEYGRRVPTVLRAGFLYKPQKNIFLSSEIEKNTDQQVAVKVGLEYQIWEKIFVRTGVGARPLTQHFGAGLKTKKFFFDYAVHASQQLGWSHHLSLGYIFWKRGAD